MGRWSTVKALEQGSWLVLDNANLCSASVLDRLNSLLEPDGSLIINEHCDSNGKPKIVRCHPDFRIFLTMDPKHGELSRAMRNRAIEIFLDHVSPGDLLPIQHAAPEAALSRYRNVAHFLNVDDFVPVEARELQVIAFDNLSWSDMSLLSRFVSVYVKDMLPQAATHLKDVAAAYKYLYKDNSNAKYRQTLQDVWSAAGRSLDTQVSARDVLLLCKY